MTKLVRIDWRLMRGYLAASEMMKIWMVEKKLTKFEASQYRDKLFYRWIELCNIVL